MRNVRNPFSEKPYRMARSWSAIVALQYAFIQTLMYFILVPEEIHDLQALIKEVRYKIMTTHQRDKPPRTNHHRVSTTKRRNRE